MSSLINWVIFFLSQPRISPLLAMPHLAFFLPLLFKVQLCTSENIKYQTNFYKQKFNFLGKT
jgi:hypothetical protein